VIVFDRVRENIPILRRLTAPRIVNESLAETITRSLNTSLVTLIPVILLYWFGSGSLQDFAFALIVGIASGAYSSIFVAAPLLSILLDREPAFVKRREELEKHGGLEATAPTRRAAAPAAAATASPAMEGPRPLPEGEQSGVTHRRRRRGRPHGRHR
jgi:SecD/SecF fusion protein